MDTVSVVEGFADLFEGRKDAIGLPSGGCLRLPPSEFDLNVWRQHLEGAAPIGVYPMVYRADPWQTPEWFVKWGCVDFDIKSEGHRSWDYEHEHEAHTAAVNLQKVLAALRVTAWIERTRSCGRHVWVFSSSWVPAQTMRRSLLISCGVAGVSQREVNPKQETLAEGQLGNYVRLPYPGALRNLGMFDAHQHVIFPGVAPHVARDLQSFVREALAARTSPDVLGKIAAKWRDPEPQRSIEVEQYIYNDGYLNLLLHRLNHLGRHVFLDGPDDGDRSKGLAYVAYQGRLSGLSPNEALTLIYDADKRWGKFSERPDRDKRLAEVVERAWQ